MSTEILEPGQLRPDEQGLFRCGECERDAEFITSLSAYLCRECLDDMNREYREMRTHANAKPAVQP